MVKLPYPVDSAKVSTSLIYIEFLDSQKVMNQSQKTCQWSKSINVLTPPVETLLPLFSLRQPRSPLVGNHSNLKIDEFGQEVSWASICSVYYIHACMHAVLLWLRVLFDAAINPDEDNILSVTLAPNLDWHQFTKLFSCISAPIFKLSALNQDNDTCMQIKKYMPDIYYIYFSCISYIYTCI